jgi:hypothetical protein
MYNPDVPFSTDDYILTSTKNIISRSSNIHKPSALEIPLGRCFIAHGVTIRADLATVQIQKYTFIGEGNPDPNPNPNHNHNPNSDSNPSPNPNPKRKLNPIIYCF